MTLSWKKLSHVVILLFLVFLAIDASVALAQTPGSAFFGTRWNVPGPKNAVFSPPTVGGTFGNGAADWSVVAMGTPTLLPPDTDHPMGAMTLDFNALLPIVNPIRPAALFQQALNIWQVGSLGSWTNLGNVIDGGGDIGDNVAVGNTSDTGDIRAAVLQWINPEPSSQPDMDVIAHGFRPGTLVLGGTIGGDVHFRPHVMVDPTHGVNWVDNKKAPAGSVDLLTVMIHEVGHALGLLHNIGDPNSVMQPTYTGPNRKLSATDRRNIRQLYAAAGVPEPTCMVLFGMALPWLWSRRGCRV